MPFALTFTGLMLIITGFQDTYKQFGTLVRGDFTGSGGNNFIWWMLSVAVIGGLGYIKSLETFSRAFMGLILLVLVIAMYKQNPGVFASISSGVAAGSTAPVNPIGAPLPGGSGASGSAAAGGGGGFDLSNIGQDASIAASVAAFL